MLLYITPTLFIADELLEERFIASSGPGGQNVNKVATAVQLRFQLSECETLPPSVKFRLKRLAGRRLGADGVLTISASRFRTQAQNRDDARARLFAMIQEAAVVPVLRRATKPTKGSKLRRLESKSHVAKKKTLRREKLDPV